MILLTLAALFFVGIHLGIAATPLRARLIAGWGKPRYLGVFAALSALGLTALIASFLHARVLTPTALMDWRGLGVLLNFVAFVFIACGVLPRTAPPAGELASGLHRVTRHPMLWGIALWAGTHVIYNPQPASALFFGAFLLLALLGPRSIDAKRAAQDPAWPAYAAVTSNLPFAAIAQGRNRLVWDELLRWPLLAAALVTELLVLYHAQLFGLPAW